MTIATKWSISFIAIAVCTLAGSAAANNSIRLFTPASAWQGALTFESAHYVRIDPAIAEQLRTQRAAADIMLALDEGSAVTIHLQPYSVYTADVKWIRMTATGPVQMAQPDIATYRGSVDGDPASRVYFGIDRSGVTGFVINNGRGYSISPKQSPVDGAQYCLVYQDAKRPAALSQTSCAMRDNLPAAEPAGPSTSPLVMPNPGANEQPTAARYLVRLAIDMDFEGYTYFQSDAACQSYATNIIGISSTLYEAEVSTQMAIGFFRAWSTPSPYTNNDLYGALDEFTQYWNANMTSEQRGATALFSKRGCGASGNGACGLAELGGLCQSTLAYSVNQISGNIDMIDKYVVAHEIGHNFGARHTHSCWWVTNGFSPTPIEECAAAEDGNCFSGVTQSQGTLMGYCDSKDFTFGTIVGPWVKDNVVSIASKPYNCFVASEKLATIDSVIDFGVIHPDTQIDSNMTAFITNVGQKSVTVSAITLDGPDSTSFSILSGATPVPFTVAAGAKHALKLRFSCSDVGTRDAWLHVKHSAPNSPLNVHLRGAGGLPSLTFFTNTGEDTVIWFADQANTTYQIGVFNAGDFPVHITRSRISGPDSTSFRIMKGAGAINLPNNGDQDSIVVKFAPVSGGAKNASLIVTTNGTPADRTVALIGGVIDAVRDGAPMFPEVTLSPAYPNPVVATPGNRARLSFSLPAQTAVSLTILDMLGREVVRLEHGTMSAGTYESHLDVSHFTPGAYVVRLAAAGRVVTGMVQVVR